MESEKIAARIDGEKIKKVENGELDDMEVIELLRESELAVFAWQNKDILKEDERYFCVRLDMPASTELEEVDDILKGAIPEHMEIRDDKVVVLAYIPTVEEWKKPKIIAARIDGEKIKKVENGELDDIEVIELLRESELSIFAWFNKDSLKEDERYFCTRLDIPPSKADVVEVDDMLKGACAEHMEIRDDQVVVLAYEEKA